MQLLQRLRSGVLQVEPPEEQKEALVTGLTINVITKGQGHGDSRGEGQAAASGSPPDSRSPDSTSEDSDLISEALAALHHDSRSIHNMLNKIGHRIRWLKTLNINKLNSRGRQSKSHLSQRSPPARLPRDRVHSDEQPASGSATVAGSAAGSDSGEATGEAALPAGAPATGSGRGEATGASVAGAPAAGTPATGSSTGEAAGAHARKPRTRPQDPVTPGKYYCADRCDFCIVVRKTATAGQTPSLATVEAAVRAHHSSVLATLPTPTLTVTDSQRVERGVLHFTYTIGAGGTMSTDVRVLAAPCLDADGMPLAETISMFVLNIKDMEGWPGTSETLEKWIAGLRKIKQRAFPNAPAARRRKAGTKAPARRRKAREKAPAQLVAAGTDIQAEEQTVAVLASSTVESYGDDPGDAQAAEQMPLSTPTSLTGLKRKRHGDDPDALATVDNHAVQDDHEANSKDEEATVAGMAATMQVASATEGIEGADLPMQPDATDIMMIAAEPSILPVRRSSRLADRAALLAAAQAASQSNESYSDDSDVEFPELSDWEEDSDVSDSEFFETDGEDEQQEQHVTAQPPAKRVRARIPSEATKKQQQAMRDAINKEAAARRGHAHAAGANLSVKAARGFRRPDADHESGLHVKHISRLLAMSHVRTELLLHDLRLGSWSNMSDLLMGNIEQCVSSLTKIAPAVYAAAEQALSATGMITDAAQVELQGTNFFRTLIRRCHHAFVTLDTVRSPEKWDKLPQLATIVEEMRALYPQLCCKQRLPPGSRNVIDAAADRTYVAFREMCKKQTLLGLVKKVWRVLTPATFPATWSILDHLVTGAEAPPHVVLAVAQTRNLLQHDRHGAAALTLLSHWHQFCIQHHDVCQTLKQAGARPDEEDDDVPLGVEARSELNGNVDKAALYEQLLRIAVRLRVQLKELLSALGVQQAPAVPPVAARTTVAAEYAHKKSPSTTRSGGVAARQAKKQRRSKQESRDVLSDLPGISIMPVPSNAANFVRIDRTTAANWVTGSNRPSKTANMEKYRRWQAAANVVFAVLTSAVNRHGQRSVVQCRGMGEKVTTGGLWTGDSILTDGVTMVLMVSQYSDKPNSSRHTKLHAKGSPGLELVTKHDVQSLMSGDHGCWYALDVMKSEEARRYLVTKDVLLATDPGKRHAFFTKILRMAALRNHGGAASSTARQYVSYSKCSEGQYYASKGGLLADNDVYFRSAKRWQHRFVSGNYAPDYVRAAWSRLRSWRCNSLQELHLTLAQWCAPIPFQETAASRVSAVPKLPPHLTELSPRFAFMQAWALTKSRRQARLQRYRRRDAGLETVMAALLSGIDTTKAVMFIGAGYVGSSHWSYSTYAPIVRKLVRFLSRRMQIVMVPEFRTSQACCHCLGTSFQVRHGMGCMV